MAKAHEQRRQRAIDRYLAGDPITNQVEHNVKTRLTKVRKAA